MGVVEKKIDGFVQKCTKPSLKHPIKPAKNLTTPTRMVQEIKRIFCLSQGRSNYLNFLIIKLYLNSTFN